MSLKRYLCVGGSLNNTWLTLFNDRGGFRHTVSRGKSVRSPDARAQIEEYRILRVYDQASREHEIMAISTISDDEALHRWRPRAPSA